MTCLKTAVGTKKLSYVRRLACQTYRDKGRSACNFNAVLEPMVLDTVFDIVREQLSDPGTFRKLRKLVEAQKGRQADESAAERATLRTRVGDLVAKIKAGTEKLALLPADLIGDVVEQLRIWKCGPGTCRGQAAGPRGPGRSRRAGRTRHRSGAGRVRTPRRLRSGRNRPAGGAGRVAHAGRKGRVTVSATGSRFAAVLDLHRPDGALAAARRNAAAAIFTTVGGREGHPMNLLMVIAVYAAICKELGVPMAFPGTRGAYTALFDATDATHLARAAAWAATEPRCSGEAFNITNGDLFRWEHLWPRIASMFDLPPAAPLPLPLGAMMADKGPLWQSMIIKHGLRPTPLADLVSWGFGEFVFRIEYDVFADTTKARRFGFPDVVDTEEMFERQFRELRRRKVIP
jgi:hypothetical protein